MAGYNTIFIIKGEEALLDSEHNNPFKTEAVKVPDYEDNNGTSHCDGSFYGDHGTPAPDLPVLSTLRITTDHFPRDKRTNFMIGRHPDKCDILLNDARISERQVSVHLNPDPDSLVLQNYSQHGSRITFSKQNQSKLVKDTNVWMRFETVEIVFSGNLRIQLQRFDIPANWDQYYANLIGQNEENNNDDDPPNMALLGLSTRIVTTNASKRPPVYIPDRRLGQGAFAQVYKAVEKYTGKVYAMKLYDKPEEARWEEAEMLERLQHEHIVRYVAYIRLQGQPAQLIMEYVKGPNLEEYLDSSNGHPPLNMTEAQEVLRQLLNAVSYLHSKKVVHRDIKPDNIILTQRDPIHTKLVDFGMATGKKPFETYCGTPFYLAPEVIKRRKCTDKADMFSIGVVALRLFGFLRELRLSSHGPETCLAAILQEKRSLASYGRPLPSHLDLVNRLLSEHPTDRPSAQSSLGHVFFASNVQPELSPGQSSLGSDLRTQMLHPWAVEYGPSEVSTEIADSRRNHNREDTQSTHHHHHTSRHGARHEESRSYRSRSGSSASSASSARHKRPKQGSSNGSGSGRSTFHKSGAPSPPSHREDHSSSSLTSHEYDGYNDGNYLFHNYFDQVLLPSIDEGGIPDTALTRSIPGPQTLGESHQNPQQSHQLSFSEYRSVETSTSEFANNEVESEADLYDGRWLDPSPVLGAGPSLQSQHLPAKASHASPPPSEETPIIQALSKLRDIVDCDTEPVGPPQLTVAPQAVENDTIDGNPYSSGAGFQLFPEINDVHNAHAKERTVPRVVRHRKRTSPEDKARLEEAYQQNTKPGRDELLRVQQTVSMSQETSSDLVSKPPTARSACGTVIAFSRAEEEMGAS